MNVIKFKPRKPVGKQSSTTKEAKSVNLLNIKLQLMANLTDMLYVAEEEYKDLSKGVSMTCTAPDTGNVYVVSIKRIETNDE